MYPDDLKYTAEHEWVRGPDAQGTVRVGITDFAQSQLGDIVFVSLPEVGASVVGGQPCGELESTKSVSELYAPLSGVVTASNSAVETAPELINSEPYASGWMFELRPADQASLSELLGAEEYRAGLDH